MNFSQCIANLLISLYKRVNRTGILEHEIAQSVFIPAYFTYKKFLEDPNAKLIKKYPHFFHDGHILDIGSNIGYTAYIYSKVLTPGYQIFAFEPEKRNIKILQKVAKNHHLSDKLTIISAAVGNTEGEIEIWQNNDHHADHRILTDALRKQLSDKIQVQKVPLISIDQFIKSQNITQPIKFIKIDVQGYELAVCQGMQQTLLSNPNCVICFEYSPSIIENLGFCTQELIAFFKDKNYLFYRLHKNGALKLLDMTTDSIINSSNSFQGYFDIICSKQNLNAFVCNR